MVQQGIDLEDAHMLGTCRDPHNLVSRFHLAFLQNTEVETGPAVRDQQRGHLRFVHADAHPVTSHARLGDLEQSLAYSEAIANAHFLVRQAVDGEILTELPMGEVVSTELAPPITIESI